MWLKIYRLQFGKILQMCFFSFANSINFHMNLFFWMHMYKNVSLESHGPYIKKMDKALTITGSGWRLSCRTSQMNKFIWLDLTPPVLGPWGTMRGLAHTLSTIVINNIFSYKIYNDTMRSGPSKIQQMVWSHCHFNSNHTIFIKCQPVSLRWITR